MIFMSYLQLQEAEGAHVTCMRVMYSTYLFVRKRSYVPCRALLRFVHLNAKTNEAQFSQAQINRG